MKSGYRQLGDFIEEVTRTNSDLKYGIDDVRGCSNTKKMMQTRANLIGRTYEKFIVLKPGEFVFNRRTSRNGEKIGMAYNDTDREYIFTEDYVAFRVRDECISELLPEYLYLFFCRSEFDRYARFKSHGSATEFFNWEDMCAVPFTAPDIEEQKKIVHAYKVIEDRINLKKRINENLEEQAISHYKLVLQHCSPELVVQGTISDLGEFIRGNIITSSEMIPGNIPVISAGITPSGYHNQHNVQSPSITISGSGVNAGYISFHSENIWAADCSFNNNSNYIYSLYVILKSMQTQITSDLQRGTAQPHVYPKDINPFGISYPITSLLKILEKNLNPIFTKISDNSREIRILSELLSIILTDVTHNQHLSLSLSLSTRDQ